MKKLICITAVIFLALLTFACKDNAAESSINNSDAVSRNSTADNTEEPENSDMSGDESHVNEGPILESSDTESNIHIENPETSVTSDFSQIDDTDKEPVQISFRALISDDLALYMVEDKDAEYIYALLENAQWLEGGTTDCASDYVINVGEDTYYYHSDCGTFNDSANQRSFTLGDGSRAQIHINAILGVKTENENTDAEASLLIFTNDSRNEALLLDDESADRILAFIKNGEWQESRCKCIYDYVFELTENGVTKVLHYCGSCGHVIDSENEKHIDLGESKSTMNALLGYEDPYVISSDTVNAVAFTVAGDSIDDFDNSLKPVIDSYIESNLTVKLGKADIACFDVGFQVKSVFASRIAHTSDGDIYAELGNYIDLYLPIEFKGSKIVIPTDWWYDDSDWVNKYPVWTYTLHVVDMDGNDHWYYLRIEHTK